MIAAAALVALSAAAADAPLVESYSELSRPQLLEQRRLLKEATPSMVFPVLTTVFSPIPILIGVGLLVAGLNGIAKGSGSRPRSRDAPARRASRSKARSR